MFVSFIIVIAPTLNILVPSTLLANVLPVDLTTVVVAAITLIGSVILHFTKLVKSAFKSAFIAYALLTLTVASAILSTGQTESSLIGLWIGIAMFAGVFGWYGYSLILTLCTGYAIYAYTLIQPTPESIVLALAASVTSLIASFIIWHNKSSKEATDDKAYRQLATELSHEANKSETVINAINDGVISIDTQGVIQLFNPAAGRIIGWGKEDAVGLSYKSVLKLNNASDKPVEPTEDPVASVIATNQEIRTEQLSIATESGKKILLSVVVSPIGTPSTGAIIVFRDITKEKSEEREQAEFISTASHEMRTPVASIEGYLGLTLNPATATIDDKARDYIQKAHESARHLGRLFQDLLDVTKAEDGRMTNNPSVVDMVEYIGTVVEGLKPKAEEKGLRFLYKPQPDPDATERTVAPVYYAHVDNDHLREVVSNLVENAIKYTPKGDVVIDIGGDATHVTVSVQDSGIGIPTEDIQHLFQKFYRVDNSDTREIGGTGLGLYLCRRLAELMGGSIKVSSEYKKGSTFTLELPRIDHMEAQRFMEASAAARETTETTKQDTPEAFIPEPTPPPLAQTPAAPAQPANEPQQPVLAAPAEQQNSAASAYSVQPPHPSIPPVAYTAPVQQQPIRRPVTPQAPNIPLSQLEQNPSAYVTARPPMQIPSRRPGDSNQA